LFDIVLITAHSKYMAYVLRRRAVPVARWVAELAAVIGQDGYVSCKALPWITQYLMWSNRPGHSS
jgi:hypothetical protein